MLLAVFARVVFRGVVGLAAGVRPAENIAENSPRKHCKKHERRNHHPTINSDKCFWNKTWKGYRPRYVCKALNTRFKERDTFAPDLGGYESSGGESYESE